MLEVLEARDQTPPQPRAQIRTAITAPQSKRICFMLNSSGRKFMAQPIG